MQQQKHQSGDTVELADYFAFVHPPEWAGFEADNVMHVHRQLAVVGQPIICWVWMVSGTWVD